jgi:hypothetical protein
MLCVHPSNASRFLVGLGIRIGSFRVKAVELPDWELMPKIPRKTGSKRS